MNLVKECLEPYELEVKTPIDFRQKIHVTYPGILVNQPDNTQKV